MENFDPYKMIESIVSEVEQEQTPGGNGDREAIVVGAGLCEGERAYTVYDPKSFLERYS